MNYRNLNNPELVEGLKARSLGNTFLYGRLTKVYIVSTPVPEQVVAREEAIALLNADDLEKAKIKADRQSKITSITAIAGVVLSIISLAIQFFRFN